MSKSRNSKIYQPTRGEDLIYENEMFNDYQIEKQELTSTIKNIKNRRELRNVKHQLQQVNIT
jgi:hypothetical protein